MVKGGAKRCCRGDALADTDGWRVPLVSRSKGIEAVVGDLSIKEPFRRALCHLPREGSPRARVAGRSAERLGWDWAASLFHEIAATQQRSAGREQGVGE